jgi:16S rRNA (guanine966-N2)-methyltransferase
VFSALEARDALRGARVLDLYAGSGALGLEAASRGASAVTLVERSHPAAAICRRNAAAISKAAPATATPRLTVVVAAVRSFLTSSKAEPGGFDLVFLDPPYDLSDSEVAADLECVVALLAEDAVVVVERNARSPEPAWPTGITLLRRKDYGDTAVWTAVLEPAES